MFNIFYKLILLTLIIRAGFSDPVYAEAYVNVHQYDILLGNNNICVFLFEEITN